MFHCPSLTNHDATVACANSSGLIGASAVHPGSAQLPEDRLKRAVVTGLASSTAGKCRLDDRSASAGLVPPGAHVRVATLAVARIDLLRNLGTAGSVGRHRGPSARLREKLGTVDFSRSRCSSDRGASETALCRRRGQSLSPLPLIIRCRPAPRSTPP